MKKLLVFFVVLCGLGPGLHSQDLVLRRGVVLDSLPVQDSLASKLRLYLPDGFDPSKTWPLLFVCNDAGESLQAMRYLKKAADANGYVVAASRELHDTVSLASKVLKISNSLVTLMDMLPLDPDRVYTAGYRDGGELALIHPALVPAVRGGLVIASGIPEIALSPESKKFHIVGIMGKGDFRFHDLWHDEGILDQLRFPNHMIFHSGNGGWPTREELDLGLQTLTLLAIRDKRTFGDSVAIARTYQAFTHYVQGLEEQGEYLLAHGQLQGAQELFKGIAETGPFREREKAIRRESGYKEKQREWQAAIQKENDLRHDYFYYLEQDVAAFNLNNLGWWRYQADQINGMKGSAEPEERLLGHRLEGYLNALVDDNIRMVAKAEQPDEDALIFLYMLKTVTAPLDFGNYLQVVSLTAKYGDFGTANFYLEELLRKGYQDAQRLYSLPNTALLRITPEYNQLIEKYLRAARYDME
jgi:hypothetical protein